jgi:von Willebrand factor type A domain
VPLSSAPRRVGRCLAGLLAASLALSGWLTAPSSGPVGAGVLRLADSPSPPPVLAPLDVVVLVDESGSLLQEGVAEEQAAANTIVGSIVAPGSVVSIVGFGSDSGAEGSRPAAEPLCPPVTLDGQAGRERLAGCVATIRERTPAEGNHTDHVRALRLAEQLLAARPGPSRIVFLLTDGGLDVDDSREYGESSPGPARTAEAEKQIPGALQALEVLGAQVWPLGFGKVQRQSLDRLATGHGCSSTVQRPQAQIAGDARQLVRAVQVAVQAATCVRFGDDASDEVGDGGRIELKVDIPVLATDAAIVVHTGSDRFRVGYVGPDGGEIDPAGDGDGNGRRYDLTGPGTPTEVLHVVDPAGGPWTVVVSAPPGAGRQAVTATVATQAAVNTGVTVDQQEAVPGQTIDVAMSVLAHRRVVTDPATLAGLEFHVDLDAGGETTVLQDTGGGIFRATIPVPENASDTVTATGHVTGIGIAPGSNSYHIPVRTGPEQLSFGLTLSASSLDRGGAVPGKVGVSNLTRHVRRLVMRLDGAPDGLRLEADADTVPPGQSQVRFRLRAESDMPVGPATATVQVFGDEAGPLLYQRLLALTIDDPPGPFDRFWAEASSLARDWWGGLVALTVAGLALLVWRGRGRRVRGLRASLTIAGLDRTDPLDPLHRWSPLFWMTVDHRGSVAHLRRVRPGDLAALWRNDRQVFVVRRSGDGLTSVPKSGTSEGSATPGLIEPTDIRRNRSRAGVTLSVRDDRPRVEKAAGRSGP